MATIAQLIAHLSTLPQDTNVEVLQERDGGWHTYTSWMDLEVDKYSNNMEYSEHAKTLYLGRN